MSKFSIKIAGILLLALLLAPVLAVENTIALKPDAPDSYQVQADDTLWSIAERFLRAPWQWPQVWKGNPELSDPNLIYPGDTVVLEKAADGLPSLSVRRSEQPLVKLSPQIRVEQLEQPIPVIPLNIIHQFLTRPYVVEPGALEHAPYVVNAGKNHIIGGPGQKIYIRSNGHRIRDQRHFVVRPGKLYTDSVSGEVLGQEAVFIAEVETIRQGDPLTAQVLQAEIELKVGDRLIRASDEEVITRFYPSAPEDSIQCAIINNLSGLSKMGRYDVVALDCGQDQGIVPGDVLTIDQRGDTIYDPVWFDREAPDRRIDTRHRWLDEYEQPQSYSRVERWVFPDENSRLELPDEPIGTLMVFRTFPGVSFALIMQSTDAISLLDRARSPDR
jgi:LysM repeat protein